MKADFGKEMYLLSSMLVFCYLDFQRYFIIAQLSRVLDVRNITYALLPWGNREKLEATRIKDRERVVDGKLGIVFDV